MEFEKQIRNKLLMRGFTNKQLLNNRGLIGATIDESILLTVKNLSLSGVSHQRELLQAFKEHYNDHNTEGDVNIHDFHIDDFINSL